MNEVVIFSNGQSLDKEYIEKAQEAALLAIKKELPEEMFFQEAINVILERCKEDLKYKKICL